MEAIGDDDAKKAEAKRLAKNQRMRFNRSFGDLNFTSARVVSVVVVFQACTLLSVASDATITPKRPKCPTLDSNT